MKVVNRIRYGIHVAEIQNIAGMYKVVVDKEQPGTLHATQREAENAVYEQAREYLGINLSRRDFDEAIS